jgi:hypothetical protein
VQIRVVGTTPDNQIDGLFRVEPSGKVPLGPGYGRVQVAGLTFEDAETELRKKLMETLTNPEVMITAGEVTGPADERLIESVVNELRQLRSDVNRLRAATTRR